MNRDIKQQHSDIQDTYAKKLLGTIEAIAQAWSSIQADKLNPDALREFHRLAHHLSGSGRTFGYPAISAGAQGIERIIEDALASQSPLSDYQKKKISDIFVHLGQAAQSRPTRDVGADNNDTPDHQPSSDSRTILIVDDDPTFRSLLKLKLQTLGLKVISAYDGQEGYAKALSEIPDLIITDHIMPNSTSLHMLSNIRRNNMTANIPVIVITAQKFNGERDHALERELTGRHGAIAYLEKPVDFETLLQQIKRVIPI